jgi:hypothetical protein
MDKLERELRSISKTLNILARKVEEIAAKSGGTGKRGAKAGRKVRKKQHAGKSAPDIVMAIIKSRKKGVDNATLREKTGFGGQKIRDTLYRLSQRGRIRRVGRGLYRAVE